jgi:hypothetical protein
MYERFYYTTFLKLAYLAEASTGLKKESKFSFASKDKSIAKPLRKKSKNTQVVGESGEVGKDTQACENGDISQTSHWWMQM